MLKITLLTILCCWAGFSQANPVTRASGTITADAVATGASSGQLKTPSATTTLDSSGNMIHPGRMWTTNGVTYTSGGALPGTCTFGDRFLLTTTSIWHFCYSANAWEASTASANDSVTLGNALFGGHMSIGNESQPDRDIDTCILCLRDTSVQTSDHSIGLSVTNIWAPSANPNARSFALVDILGYISATGLTIPMATGVSDNFGLVAGTLTASRGFAAATPLIIGGTITNRWGLFFNNQCTAGITNCYAMETQGGGHVFGDFAWITGRQDVIQLRVKGNATQTSSLFRLEDSAAVARFEVANSGAITSATLDAEATGNTLTTVERIYRPAARCTNATAAPFYNLPTANAAGSACLGTTTTNGILTFADAATTSASFEHRLPSDWTGTMDAVVSYTGSTNSTNNIRWQISNACVADTEDIIAPSYNATSAANSTGPTTAGQRRTATFTSVAVTNCAAGEEQWWKIERVGADAGDTYTGVGHLLGIQLVYRRAQ